MSDLRITGVYMQYYFVCKRKLWLFAKHLKMEEKSDLVTMGKQIDEHTFKREKKHIDIDETISIDFIGNQGTIHEIKKGNSMDRADTFQLKYYLYYLYKRGVTDINGVINYPKLKEKVRVELTAEDIKKIESVMKEIASVLKKDIPPPVINSKICKKCKEFLNHIQNSVFEGELTEGQMMQLKYELSELIREDKDSIIFFSSSKEDWLNKEILGLNKNAFSNLL